MPPRQTQSEREAQRTRLVRLLEEIAPKVGVHATAIAGVDLIRDPNPAPCGPVVYTPGIIFVAQGRKRGFIGGKVLLYDPHHYLVLSVPLPFEREILCSPQEPLLVVRIAMDASLVGEVLLDMDEPLPSGEKVPRAICSTPVDDRMGAAVIRLLECLRSARDCKVLGRQIVREITYLVLIGEQGEALRAVAARNERFEQLARVLRNIHADPAQAIGAAMLARAARMSVSTFHHTFKLMTATSPVQYVKRIRLDAARRLMIHEGHTASSAAATVGYKSVPQFSREFKRLFGATPAEDAANMRGRLSGSAG